MAKYKFLGKNGAPISTGSLVQFEVQSPIPWEGSKYGQLVRKNWKFQIKLGNNQYLLTDERADVHAHSIEEWR